MDSSPLLAGVLQRNYDRANMGAPMPAPPIMSTTSPQNRPKSTPAYPSSNHLISARSTLLKLRSNLPGYARLPPTKKFRHARKIEALGTQIDLDYQLLPHLSKKDWSRRAIMAPRDASRIRKMRKGLGACGRKKAGKKLSRELARKMRERDPIIGGDEGVMWINRGRTKRSSRLGCVESVGGVVEMMNGMKGESQWRALEMQELEARFWGGYVRLGEAVLEAEPEWERELRGDLDRDAFEAFLESDEQEWGGEPRSEYSWQGFAAFLENRIRE
ncbi:uncharacterized protein N0V89_004495 [Didymosphaeria variabile]|uniref:Uncharacterized protein n=1 Tax=Didymosphaeria variabile TaxID=1932322 RepID=A0A9W8XQM2_9PLEO|nr:uncharacterized protein N0V89_004495 [Didymosphaeria variabile]KAJ4356462.1 hypothetical protein N0V89_004495 [Didymosphaeria variabile]